MKLNHNKLGGAALAASPILLNVVHGPVFWWLGFAFASLGPLLIALEYKPKTKRAR